MDKKVSIITITYNQEKFITQALDSFIYQKTNFPFEVIVSDDCSTDETQNIIKKYAEQYPDIIKPILREQNVGSEVNYIEALKMSNSKYTAICDGDDYWTDPYKLQRQVDYMEAHPDCAVSFHKMKTVYENSKKMPQIIPIKMGKKQLTFKSLCLQGYIPSNTIMYRTEYLKPELKNYPEEMFPLDWFNNIMIAKHGKIGFINKVMAVYRRNEGGISYTTEKDHEKELHKKYGIKEMNFFFEVWQRIKDIYPEYYTEMFLPKLRDIYFTYLQMGDFEKLDILKERYSEYFKDMESGTGIASKKHKKYKKMFTVSLIINIVLTVFLLVFGLLYLLNII